MTEQTVKTQNGKSRLSAPRIDLTPMVDLAFLLITFFIFNSTLTNPTAMTTLLPANSSDSSTIAESGAVSIIAGATEMHVYVGNDIRNVQILTYEKPDELRKKLLALQQLLIAREGNDEKLFIMIKPTDNTPFEHIVALLDEMKICGMKRYTFTDMSQGESIRFGAL